MTLARRAFLGALVCAPAIVRASSLMPIKTLKPLLEWRRDGGLYVIESVGGLGHPFRLERVASMAPDGVYEVELPLEATYCSLNITGDFFSSPVRMLVT